jgi:hypothetical protein
MFIPTENFAWLLYLCYWWRGIECKCDWIPSPSLLYQCHENLSQSRNVNSRLHIHPLTQTCVSIQMSLASLHTSRTALSFPSILTHISAWLFHIHFISLHCYVFIHLSPFDTVMISRLTTAPATHLQVFVNILSSACKRLSLLHSIWYVGHYNINHETSYPGYFSFHLGTFWGSNLKMARVASLQSFTIHYSSNHSMLHCVSSVMETNTSELFHNYFTQCLTMLFVTQYFFIDLSNCF